MEDFSFAMPKIETMPGSEAGSTFTVISKAANLKLGIRAFPSALKHNGKAWAAITFRLRVETTDGSSCSAEMATGVFGDLNFSDRGSSHSSAVAVLPLVTLPSTPAAIYAAYEALDNVEASFIEQLTNKFNKGITLCLDENMLVSILQESITDFIPAVAEESERYASTVFLFSPKKNDE